jgi:hypothetical protein
MNLIMPTVGFHLLLAVGFGAIAQAIFGTPAFF